MSLECAKGLSPYNKKGILGLSEKFDSTDDVASKVALLTKWIKESNYVVVHTGAGISTSAGIPDFRGPNGVWTLEKQGKIPDISTPFDDAKPTVTHMALMKLVETGVVKFIVSQNVDGLHMRSGIPRRKMAELHGNIFVMKCHLCQRQFVGSRATQTVGQKYLGISCLGMNLNGRPCRGKLYDTVVDWEDDLPQKDLGLSEYHCGIADLSICLGTTLQVAPSGTLPLITTKYEGGRFAICNLQPTKWDNWSGLIVNTYVDDMIVKLMESLNLDIPNYDEQSDPTRNRNLFAEWTLFQTEVDMIKSIFEAKRCTNKSRKITAAAADNKTVILKRKKYKQYTTTSSGSSSCGGGAAGSSGVGGGGGGSSGSSQSCDPDETNDVVKSTDMDDSGSNTSSATVAIKVEVSDEDNDNRKDLPDEASINRQQEVDDVVAKQQNSQEAMIANADEIMVGLKNDVDNVIENKIVSENVVNDVTTTTKFQPSPDIRMEHDYCSREENNDVKMDMM